MSDEIVLYGSDVSPHVRATRIVFAERGVDVRFEPIGGDHLATADYGRINPFRKMPALVHGDLTLYETPALMTYAGSLGSGPSLEPTDPVARARMWQYVGVAQHYLHPVGVMKLYFHAVLAGVFGMEPDLAAAEGAVQPTTAHLDVIEGALGSRFLAGDALSHADLYCGVMVDYVARTRAGRAMVEDRPHVGAWIDALRARPSFAATFAPMLAGTDQI